ncbi:MAG TPA: hypothetical protein VFA03_03945 [Acetobacteraceae bacterium]|nr:hypothetical protein [Acetobacteraceae bacterium]
MRPDIVAAGDDEKRLLQQHILPHIVGRAVAGAAPQHHVDAPVAQVAERHRGGVGLDDLDPEPRIALPQGEERGGEGAAGDVGFAGTDDDFRRSRIRQRPDLAQPLG